MPLRQQPPIAGSRPGGWGIRIDAGVDRGLAASPFSADVRIFDRQSIWVSTLHAGVDLSAASVIHDLREALAQDGESASG